LGAADDDATTDSYMALHLHALLDILAQSKKLKSARRMVPQQSAISKAPVLNDADLRRELCEFLKYVFKVVPGCVEPVHCAIEQAALQRHKLPPLHLCVHMEQKCVSMKFIIELRALESARNGSTVSYLPSCYELRQEFYLIERLAQSLFGGEVSDDRKFFTLDIDKTLRTLVVRLRKIDPTNKLGLFQRSNDGRDILCLLFCADGTNLGNGRGLVTGGINAGGNSGQSKNACFPLCGFTGKETKASVKYYLEKFYR
jgi:hypothetical protein